MLPVALHTMHVQHPKVGEANESEIANRSKDSLSYINYSWISSHAEFICNFFCAKFLLIIGVGENIDVTSHFFLNGD